VAAVRLQPCGVVPAVESILPLTDESLQKLQVNRMELNVEGI